MIAGQLSIFDASEYIGDGYIRGNGRTFRVIRGTPDYAREWNIYYDDGRIMRYVKHNRPGYCLSGKCGPDGELLKPIPRPMPGTGGELITPDNYPGTYHDSSN